MGQSSKDLDYDAELTFYEYHPIYGKSLHGSIYNDTKNRFSDGEYIITSTVLKIEDGIATTLNTKYKLGEKIKC